ncbi:MAG: hypothetical protein EZS28_007993 [Streblomastix strix]|uniref:Uncharacterized protein n=1 Tax=Streblomastix strix TaxID=222440 RepID=A0A5J4WNH0_9EUKA|nr:MAG: hypothetical protein EZS28_007993 [Streblomastix strix]
MIESSLRDSQSTASEIELSDDNLEWGELQKITGWPKQYFKPPDFKFPPSTIKKDVRAVAPEQKNFPTAIPPQRWEGHNDEEDAVFVILDAVTSRSIHQIAETDAKDSLHVQAAREALVLNKFGKLLKATAFPLRAF